LITLSWFVVFGIFVVEPNVEILLRVVVVLRLVTTALGFPSI
jgi:hypothetical protein